MRRRLPVFEAELDPQGATELAASFAAGIARRTEWSVRHALPDNLRLVLRPRTADAGYLDPDTGDRTLDTVALPFEAAHGERAAPPRIFAVARALELVFASDGAVRRFGSVPFFSETHKMNAPSWSLPAGPRHAGGTCPASEARPAHGRRFVCHGCYALGGSYIFAINQARQLVRLRWTLAALREGTFVEHVLAALSAFAERPPTGLDPRFFRLHDSGDFMASPAYVTAWCEVARRSPSVTFWAPTRDWVFFPEHASAHGFKPIPALREAMLARPRNLVLRPSALHVGDPPPRIEGLDAGTTVLDLPAAGMDPLRSRLLGSLGRDPVPRDVVARWLELEGFSSAGRGHFVSSSGRDRWRLLSSGRAIRERLDPRGVWSETRQRAIDAWARSLSDAADAGGIARCHPTLREPHCHCPAYDRGGSCAAAGCRTCWAFRDRTVDYLEH